MRPKIGIVAGGGNLPARLIESCRAQSRDLFVIALKDQADPHLFEMTEGATPSTVPHAWVRLGAVGTSIKLLKEAGVEELILAGAIRRPSVAALRPDLKAMKFFARTGAAALGDDGLLSAIVSMLEDEGFKVVGVDSVLPDALAKAGAFGRERPDSQAEADIERGVAAVRAIGAVDAGQAAVVQQGLILALEAIEGTDAMLERCAALRREGPGGVLVKIRKPGQENRADLPTIGVATIRKAREAGLRGIAIEAGGTVIVDGPAVAAAADAAGMFLVGIDIDTPPADDGRTS